MPRHGYYNTPTSLVATQNEVTSILPTHIFRRLGRMRGAAAAL